MLAMQYSVRLPQEYDLDKVYDRVAARGPKFKGHPGLKHKFYLYDHEEHIYAPMYIWENSASAREFLMNQLFTDVVQDFGRPRVRSWQILEFDYGPSSLEGSSMVAEMDKVCDKDNLIEVRNREKNLHKNMLNKEGLFANMVLLDPDRWEIARCSLWSRREHGYTAQADCVFDYEIVPEKTLVSGAA